MICGLDTRYMSTLIGDVTRPLRYCGNELNFPRKLDGRLRFLLCFPDLYEIGMSNMGVRVLYHILNREPEVLADLAFAPWDDMERFMRARGLELGGVGTARRAREFDVLAFSLQHELQYTNVLTMLDLAGVSILRCERADDEPLVIAGGPCAFNPEPMADFVDAFVLGDGETVSGEIARALLEVKGTGGGRGRALETLAELDGVYVPQLHSCESVRINRRVEDELREGDFPLPPIVPISPITHDRLTLEIMRGCTRGCRFCSAGMVTRPVRARSVGSVVRLAEQGIDASGWEEVSLVSLSTSDYADLASLVGGLNESLAEKRVSISLPSMRPGSFTDDIARLVGRTRKTGLTFAPEAGSERLRKVINKGVNEDDLYSTVETAFRNGWDAVKLYFMIGLPTEDEGDGEELVRMVRSVESICRVYGRRRRITVSLSPFVPRPHTPFQWEAQVEPEAVLSRIYYIRKHLPDKRVKLKWRDPYMAELEGLLARGDRAMGKVIRRAWQAGARFDGWTDRFDFDLWKRCLDDEGVDVVRALQARSVDHRLPWDHIGGGITPEFLLREARKAINGELTPDCRTGECSACGACPGMAAAAAESQPCVTGPVRVPSAALPDRPDIRIRFRVRYAKGEQVRLASHLDLTRCFQRGLRRSGVPVAYSRGFSPHPRLSFGPPLPLGVLGESEYLDIMFSKPPQAGWVDRVNACLPAGLRISEARMIELHGTSLAAVVNAARYSVEVWRGAVDAGTLSGMIENAFGGADRILGMSISDGDDKLGVDLTARMVAGQPRPEKVLDKVLREAGVCYTITRKDLYVESHGDLRSPFFPDKQEVTPD